MPSSLVVSLAAEISGWPAVEASQGIQITAHDQVEVEIPGAANLAAAVDTVVDVQPSAAASQVLFLSIQSSRYGADLEYDVGGGTANIALDGPHVFVGQGSIGLLGAVPEQLTFRNGLGDGLNATVTILVGRQAIS
jgi:hypothetical protein